MPSEPATDNGYVVMKESDIDTDRRCFENKRLNADVVGIDVKAIGACRSGIITTQDRPFRNSPYDHGVCRVSTIAAFNVYVLIQVIGAGIHINRITGLKIVCIQDRLQGGHWG